MTPHKPKKVDYSIKFKKEAHNLQEKHNLSNQKEYKLEKHSESAHLRRRHHLSIKQLLLMI